MKEKTGKAIQFTGYPLKIVEPKNAPIAVVKPLSGEKEIQRIQANDPCNWDIDWFMNYE